MKHSLQLKLSQHLTLTPQLQQSIRLLQLSTLELNQEIERFLQENPLLERDDGADEEGAAAAWPLIPLTSHPPQPKPRLPPRRRVNRAKDSGARAATGLGSTIAGNFSGQMRATTSEVPQCRRGTAELRDHLLGQMNLHADARSGQTHHRAPDRHPGRRRLPDPGPRRSWPRCCLPNSRSIAKT